MIALYIFIISLIANLVIYLCGKQLKIFAYIHIFVIWCIAVFSYNVVDYQNYVDSFQSIQNGNVLLNNSFEPGYYLICKFFSNIGCNYQVMRGAIITVFLLFLLVAMKKIGSSFNFVCCCFSVFPLVIDMIQLRNTLAMSILTVGITFFLVEDKKIKYSITVILASMIHISFLVYFIFLFKDAVLSKKFQKYGFIVVMIMTCVVFYVGGRNIPFLNVILSLFGDSERFNYWLTSAGNFGFIAYWILILISVFNSYCVLKHTSKQYKYADMIFKINILSICFFPLFMLASTFGRLISNLSFANYLLWDSRAYDKQHVSINKIPVYRVYLLGGCIIYLVLWFNLELYTEFDARVLLFFKNNYLFEILGWNKV